MAKATGKVYDLATDYFIGMPSFNGLGADPPGRDRVPLIQERIMMAKAPRVDRFLT